MPACLTEPYENVVVNGLILAEDGQKMSKRKKNYPDPNKVLGQYGADALRAYLIDSPVVRAEPLRFSEQGLKEILRTVVLPYWNAVSFFTTYAEVDGFNPDTDSPALADRHENDRWIISVLQSLISDVHEEMEGYRLYRVVPRLVSFIDDLTNWHIRINRPRFWKSDNKQDQNSAYATLYEVLVHFTTVLAPFMPLVTKVYQLLVRPVRPDAPQSVHWCDLPNADTSAIDKALEQRMTLMRSAVGLGRKIREDVRIKVRQPLRTLTVIHRDETVRSAIEQSAGLICDELNLKTVVTDADESAYASVVIKPNFKALREKNPPRLNQCQQRSKPGLPNKSVSLKAVAQSTSKAPTSRLLMSCSNATPSATMPLLPTVPSPSRLIPPLMMRCALKA